jgi:hypothetical protein
VNRQIMEEHRRLERQRLRFVLNRDGLGGAQRFAAQTLRIYRAGVVDKTRFMSKADWKPMFIASYLEFRRFLAQGEAWTGSNS